MRTVAQRGASPLKHSQGTDGTVDWDGLRIFLSCSRNGSFRRVAEAVGTSASTISRTIDRLEEHLGSKLFLRVTEGLLLTEFGEAMLNDVIEIERLTFDVQRRSVGVKSIRGSVKVSVTEGLGTYWVLPRLIEFQKTYPNLTVDLRCAMEQADILRLEADIAIQFDKPSQADLIMVKLGRMHVYPFASEDYARHYGLPASPRDAIEVGHRLVMQAAPQLEEEAYARLLGVPSVSEIVGIRTNSSSAVLYAVERGAGIGILPTYALALGAPVVPVDMGIRLHKDLWLTYHPELKSSEAHMRVIEWLRRIFDPANNPAFRDEFIHPRELPRIMQDAARDLTVRGFAAAKPF